MKRIINNLKDKMEATAIALKLSAKKLVSEERGDTNFISIAIIMIIVIMVAVIFIAFKDDLMDWFDEAIGDLEDALGK